MKNNTRTWAAICSAILAVSCTGCADSSTSSGDSAVSDTTASDSVQPSDQTGGTGSADTTTPHTAATTTAITPDNVSEKDRTPANTATCTITLSDSGTTINGSGAKLDGNTLTITKEGVYEVSGSCSDISIVIDADGNDNVDLILNGAKLSSKTSAAIVCSNADRLMVTLADGSENTISDGTGYNTEEDSPDAAIFSSDDLIINGSGRLTITANCQNGIKGKDDVKICGGDIVISSVDNGIVGKDYLLIDGGALDITAKGDGLKSTNDTDAELGYISITNGTVKLTTDQDAIQAQTQLMISGGNINIKTGGGSETVQHGSDGGWGDFRPGGNRFDFSDMTNASGETTESTKGMKATTGISISGGSITIDSADDSIHSDADITFSEAAVVINSGDDAFHADGNLTISSGDIEITRSYEALEAMSISILGGNINAAASDDGINVAGGDNADYYGFGGGDTSQYYLNMSGGNVTINAAGDGIDSNGSIALDGGTLIVHGPQDGANGTLDYQTSFEIGGGTLIALGSQQMSMNPSSSSQPCFTLNSSVAADTVLEIRDSSGNAVLTVTTLKSCQSLIFSSDKFTAGETYGVYAGDQLLSEVTAENGVSGSTGGFGGGGMGGFGGGGMGGFGGGHGGMGGNGGNMMRPDDMTPPDNGGFSDGMTPPDMPTFPDNESNAAV